QRVQRQLDLETLPGLQPAVLGAKARQHVFYFLDGAVHVAETLVDQLPHAPGRQQVGEVQQGIELGADTMARRGCLQRGEKPLAAGLGERVDFAVRAVRLAFLPAYHQAFPRELGECGIDRAEARDIEVAEHLLELLRDVVAARFALREDAEAQRFYVQGHGLESVRKVRDGISARYMTQLCKTHQERRIGGSATMIFQRQITVATRGRGTVAVTEEVRDVVRESGVRDGLCNIFIQHTSASLLLTENADPDVRRDLETFL